jgi:tRNA(Ile)-lysidine synthetase-like protein
MKLDLLKLVENKQLFVPGEPIVVAVSGGPDSMVLFDVLFRLNNNLIIAHVNHGKRDESVLEYQNLKKFALRKGVPFEGLTLSGHLEGNFHHEARVKRYDFFRAIASKYDATKIAIAHHLDDQVETILMRIVRGTGFHGYGGMKEIRQDRNISIIRPFLEVRKSDILAYAKERNLSYFVDESNQEDFYTRNRFRKHIIPLLRAENPRFDEKLLQLSEYIEYADELVEEHKTSFMEKYSMYNHVNLTAFNKLNRLVRIKVIQKMVNLASGNRVEVSYDQFQTIIDLCESPKPNQLYDLGNDYYFMKEYDVIYVEKLTPTKNINIQVDGPGEYFVSDQKSYIFTFEKINKDHRNFIELCYNDDMFPLQIRHRQNGDRMSLEMGTKKVKDILIDHKIPMSIRDHLFVIAKGQDVLWIPGVRKPPKPNLCERTIYIYEVK